MQPPEPRTGVERLQSGQRRTVKDPKLLDIEQTIHVLLDVAPDWRVVDEFEAASTATSSAVRIRLWRRGFDAVVRMHPERDGVVQVWARWTHDVPAEVAPWEITL